MRLIISTTKNTHTVQYNYHHKLNGTIHKWLGENNYHDDMSMYCYSFLKNYKIENGFEFKNGATFFINSYHDDFLKKIVTGIQKDPTMFCGMKVKDIQIQEEPNFKNLEKFNVGSPVFIRKNNKFYYYNDEISSEILTAKLQNKLKKVGLEHKNIKVYFDNTFKKPSTKTLIYNGIKNIGSVCPIIIEGTEEQIKFAWNVGVGNNTGIGFGSLI